MVKIDSRWQNSKMKLSKDEKWNETFSVFMLQEPQQEIEIKAILDRQLSLDRYEIKDTYTLRQWKTTREQKKCGKQEILTQKVLIQQKKER